MAEPTKNILPHINWHKYPFVRFVLPFIAGILVQQYISFAAHWLWIVPIATVLYLKVLSPSRLNLGKITVALLFVLGAQYAQQHNALPDAHFQHQLTHNRQQLLVQVSEMPEEKKWLRLVTDVKAVADSNGQTITAEGKLLLYIKRDSAAAQYIQYGDRLEVDGYINEIASPKNPHAFDFAHFMNLQNIHHQSFVKNGEWKIVARNQGSRFYEWLYGIRAKLLTILKSQLSEDRNFGVAAALTLGYRTALDDEVSTAFANSGAIHILAVSGLHVGLIAWLLSFCLQWFAHYHTYQKWIKFLVVVGGIWFFAFLTGNAPSVQRASIMFTVIAAGRYFVQHGNIYNSLSVAALISLMIDPNVLFTVGFQLSYLAVLGIVLLQPHIVELWKVKHPALKFIWNLLAVSLAAQLAVAPISIFYFHQFPIYFWLSSLVAVPAASVIMVLAVALFLTTPIPVIANFVGWSLDTVLTTLNEFIFYVNRIPFSLADGLWLSLWEVLLLYAVCISFIISYNARRTFWRMASAFFLVITCASIAGRQIYQQYQDEIVVYDIPSGTLLDYFEGRNIYTFQSENLEEQTIKFNAVLNRMSNSAQIKETFLISNTSDWKDSRVVVDIPYLQLGEKRMYVLSSNELADQREVVDYLLILNGVDLTLEEILLRIEAKRIIVDGSNSPQQVKKWRQEAEMLEVDVYFIEEDGAFLDKW